MPCQRKSTRCNMATQELHKEDATCRHKSRISQKHLWTHRQPCHLAQLHLLFADFDHLAQPGTLEIAIVCCWPAQVHRRKHISRHNERLCGAVHATCRAQRSELPRSAWLCFERMCCETFQAPS